MLGPLPRLHTTVVVVVALLVGIGTGAWLGLSDITGAERLAIPGALAGALAGGLATYVLLHDAHHRRPRPQRHRLR